MEGKKSSKGVFIAIFIMVDMEAALTNIRVLEETIVPKLKDVLREGIVLSLPLFVIDLS